MGKRLTTSDATWKCHETFYDIIEQEEHDVAVVENVPQYLEEHAKQNLSRSWGCVSHVIDPRLFGQGASRTRRYMVLWRKTKVEWIPGMILREVLESLTKRPVLGGEDYFWMDREVSSLPPKQDLKVKISVRYLYLVVLLVKHIIFGAVTWCFYSGILPSSVAVYNSRRRTARTMRRSFPTPPLSTCSNWCGQAEGEWLQRMDLCLL